MNELQLIREKNPNLRLDQILRVLWHGTRANSPLTIAQSEAGLDMRYANLGGAFGAGIYFADTAAYSISYVHPVPGQHNVKQLLLCFVIVGDSAQVGGG